MMDREEACLEFVSQNLANGKHIYELIMLQQLLQEGRFLPIMNFQLQMSHPVREGIYQYFVNE